MGDHFNIKNAGLASVLAGVYSAIVSLILIQVPFTSLEIGVFPVFENIAQVLSIILSVSLAAYTLEWHLDEDLYNDKEVFIGSTLISLISVFTVGLGVNPINLSPYWLAITATVSAQAFLFTWFVLPYARAYDFI